MCPNLSLHNAFHFEIMVNVCYKTRMCYVHALVGLETLIISIMQQALSVSLQLIKQCINDNISMQVILQNKSS